MPHITNVIVTYVAASDRWCHHHHRKSDAGEGNEMLFDEKTVTEVTVATR